jgi:recombinational DNA repair ATPase RecF
MLKKLSITNYKVFASFVLECNEGLNIIVGDNEAGKSTILEAINLALRGQRSVGAGDAQLGRRPGPPEAEAATGAPMFTPLAKVDIEDAHARYEQ